MEKERLLNAQTEWGLQEPLNLAPGAGEDLKLSSHPLEPRGRGGVRGAKNLPPPPREGGRPERVGFRERDNTH